MQFQPPDHRRPKISVLLPFRNAAQTLDECLESIQSQTFSHFELLAVDDHSGDESAKILRTRYDPRIRLLPNPGHGLVDALNFGLRAARTPLIVRMDADDIMHPERLELQHRHLSDHPELDLSASRVELFPQALIGKGYREYLRWQNALLTDTEIRDNCYVESPFAHPSVMFRRDTVAGLGGYRHRQGDFPEDYDLWLRMIRAGCRMEKLPRVLLRWRESPQRLSRRDRAYRRTAFDRLRAEYLSRDPRLTPERELAYWGAGRKTRRRAGLLVERGHEPTVWVDIDPKKIGNRIAGVPVVSSAWLAREPRPFVLVYVANHGARDRISVELESLGYRRGIDYLAVG
ncbi:MAG: glycosyltransferase [Pseudomonadota bacterium]|nr:glycosyltransferase [Pseudomonadota bacterium]